MSLQGQQGIEHLAQLASERVRGEGLLEEGRTRVEHSVVDDGGVRVARHVDDRHRGAKRRELARQLEEAGYLEWKGDEMQLTPRAVRKVGQKALQDIFAYLKKDAFGKHAISVRGR